MSDLIRVDIMVKYGGIYGDTDAIWVQPLSHEERGYDAVASFDWVDWSYPFPDSVNFGALIKTQKQHTLHISLHISLSFCSGSKVKHTRKKSSLCESLWYRSIIREAQCAILEDIPGFNANPTQ